MWGMSPARIEPSLAESGVTAGVGTEPSRSRRSGPLDVVGCLWRYREIVWQMSKREVLSRYRGSTFGLLWSFLQPLALLGLYTFVFGAVFQVRWGLPVESRGEFALVLFAGLIVYTVSRSPR